MIQPEGLKGSAMSAKQQAMMVDLASEWTGIIHDSAALARIAEIKANIAEVLASEGYVRAWAVREPDEGSVGKSLVVELKYGTNRERSLAGVRRVSKPGLRVYAKAPELPRVLGGLGVAIVSTSQGLLTDRQARKRGVGGEVLAFVW